MYIPPQLQSRGTAGAGARFRRSCAADHNIDNINNNNNNNIIIIINNHNKCMYVYIYIYVYTHNYILYNNKKKKKKNDNNNNLITYVKYTNDNINDKRKKRNVFML